MECKYKSNGEAKDFNDELIETLWNVNMFGNKRHISTLRELIETLWNVNSAVKSIFTKAVSELIETLWNVNIFITRRVITRTRINRNIVECKYR